ncbi:MAG: tetratricopeptide repeat protein [Acidobacteriota bacterium]
MKRDSLVFGIAGTFFGVLVGWIIGTQQAAPAVATTPTAAAATAAPVSPPAAAPPLDAARATELEREANARPTDAAVRMQLGNIYFDAERYDQAIPWYEASLKLDPKNVNLSTDLGVAYYYTNQTDRALTQLDRSLALDPSHLKTLLNQGIVLAFGKQDLAGAAKSWERVVEIAPNSDEGRRAKQGLDGLRSAHQTGGGASPAVPAQ